MRNLQNKSDLREKLKIFFLGEISKTKEEEAISLREIFFMGLLFVAIGMGRALPETLLGEAIFSIAVLICLFLMVAYYKKRHKELRGPIFPILVFVICLVVRIFVSEKVENLLIICLILFCVIYLLIIYIIKR